MKTILITGGHLTPALAVIEQLRKGDWHIVYVGRMYALEGDTTRSAEYTIITSCGIPFQSLTSGRLQRTFTIHTLSSLMKITIGFWQSIGIVRRHKPSVVISFGGYVALPIAVVAWLFGIPVITHEQTMRPGLTNRIIGRIAHTVCISWPDTQRFFPSNKTICTGNPLRASLFTSRSAIKELRIDKPLIYITGGSLGSQSINAVVFDVIPLLVRRFCVIHQCGQAGGKRDYHTALQLHRKLPHDQQMRYYPTPFLEPEKIGWVLKKSMMVIGRAGANTITELIAFRKPAILIPLPWSGEGEQRVHGQFLAHIGVSIVLPQQEFNAATLMQAIEKIYAHCNAYERNFSTLSIPDPQKAARHIVTLVENSTSA